MEHPRPPPVAFVLCVGFNHTAGNVIEFCQPPLESYPKSWEALPFIALPDGSHKTNEDYIFFVTTFHEETLFGVSCYRQVAASAKLKESDPTFTRSAVQKAVVCLCRLPLFGVVRSMLGAATHAYFNQENFGNTEILSGIFHSMNTSLLRCDVSKEFHSYLYMGIDVRKMLLRFGRNSLVLFKLLMAGCKTVLFTSCGFESVCNELLALCSLIPGGLTHLSEPLLRAAKFQSPLPDRHDGDLAQTNFFFPHSGRDDDLNWGHLGLPLLPFSNCDVVQSHWAKLSGKRAHKKMLFLPFVSLHALDEMKSSDGFIAATSNQLFLSLSSDQVNAIVKDDGTLEVRSQYEKTASLTTSDKRFIDFVIATVRESSEDKYVGSDMWIREQFREYIAGLLSGCGHIHSIFESNPHQSQKFDAELLDYGQEFVADFLQTGCFARWMHSCEKNYVIIGDQILHPSGPPSDALDHIADSAAEISQEFAAIKEKALKKWSTFFNKDEQQHSISSPIMDAPVVEQQTKKEEEDQDDVVQKFKNWWSGGKTTK